jgi:glycine cleavage system H protein
MMKEISELNFPEDIRYAKSHEWARSEGDTVKVGITDYAQDQLGDIVFVEMPETGETFEKGSEFGTVESVKAVSELYMPVGGEIVAVNASLEDAPELVNNTPFTDGWMLEVKPTDPGELDSLMTKDAYIESLQET